MKLLNQFVPSLFAALLIVSCNGDKKYKAEVSYPAAYLEEMTIVQLQQGYKDGKYTVRLIVSDYIARIEAIDKNGPKLNSVIIINPDALVIADELDKEMKAGKSRGPLHGVPVLLKDNIDTHDKMPNTGGSRALMTSFPAIDSKVAQK